jgi:predicted ribosome quality control (RQC) complex YloA/Tae2 family protein
MWISRRLSERASTTEFTSRLREEFERKKFVDATQVDLDRIFRLRFGEGESTTELILELMPPGNIAVTDGDGRIRLLMREVRTTRRRVVRGETYAPPEQGRLSPQIVRPDDVKEMAATEKTVGRAIGKHIALPRKYIAEVLGRLSLLEDAPASALVGLEQKVSETFRALVREVEEAPAPCICETETGDEIFAIHPRTYSVKKEDTSMSALCDDLFLDDVVSAADSPAEPSEAKRRELEVTLARLKSQEEVLLADALKARAAAVRASSSGSTEEARRILEEAGAKASKEPSSAAAVASLLFDRAKELEGRAKETRAAALRLAKRVPRAAEKREATKQITRRRQEWYEKFRWFYTSVDKLAVGGRDAQSNSTLVKRHVDMNDTVYHADLFGSPFFVLKGGKSQNEDEIREVAQATVAFSSAWKTGLGSADAYWVSPDQVSTAAPSGEFLARGSFAIKGKKNFVNKNIVEIAVGLDKNWKVVAGPEIALKNRVVCYAVIRPHREKSSDTAKRVLRDLESLVGDQTGAGPSIDDVLRALPAGGGKVIRKIGGGQRNPQVK